VQHQVSPGSTEQQPASEPFRASSRSRLKKMLQCTKCAMSLH
jgi:hypothetical protein